MRKIILYLSLVVGAVLLLKFCYFNQDDNLVEYNTNLIQEQIVNVGKLVVTEGHFSEVITYKDQDKYLMGLVSIQKKALIVVNADVTVSYDLRSIVYDIDEKNKTVTIKSIPNEEIKINPDIKFYDIDQSRLSPFTGEDYNKINKIVKDNLAKKIEHSTLKSNAKNRLVSELSKILILTNTMGWQLIYNNEPVSNQQTFESLLKG